MRLIRKSYDYLHGGNMRRELVILLVFFSVFLAIGCAEDSAEEEPAEEESGEAVTQAGEPVEPVGEDISPEETPVVEDDIPGSSGEVEAVDVSIVNSSFDPETTTITAGETVRWTNLDPTTHTVAGTGTSFRSKALEQGDSYEFLFADPGTYEYYCSIHPSMKGTVIVEEK